MRYMIAHMISGDAKAYLTNLSDVIASNYRIRSVTATIDPHLTVKAPFDALSSDVFEIEHILEKCVKSVSQHTYTVKGFGSFGDRVIFMDVEASPGISDFMTRIKEELKALPWMEFKPHEDETKIHTTICYPKGIEQARDIMSRLTARDGKLFTGTFDSIAILKKGDKRWEVYKEFKINPYGGSDII